SQPSPVCQPSAMATHKLKPNDFDESCIFCLIAHNRDEETTELVCFKDVFPAAPHHYLVVPRKHIVSCKSLNRRSISLVERMANFGKEVLRDQGITDMKDVRLGFHQPPFISVDHLHLHVLAPASQSVTIRLTFVKFITSENLDERTIFR
uniref:Histidine triad nucleotide binding protein 3 n=1 Tax=Fundulus heteroclitus TaxID=8078 RepID=A0A3Q2NNJ9_FUNHE